MAAPKSDPNNRLIASNRQARREYEVLDTIEAGIVLRGSEVKALREAKVQLRDAYGRIMDGQLYLLGLHISPYSHGHGFGAHDPERMRKLLAHRAEIDRWRGRLERERLAIVPLSLYFKDGRAKVELALGRGKRSYDKRQDIAKRDAERETQRAFAHAQRER
ncbi:MAG: SsrA-binding protein SmpB [Acidimicrobiales bacterium]